MLPKYHLIGKKISIWNGRVNVLSGFLIGLAHLLGYTLWLVVAGEWKPVAEMAAWKMMLMVTLFSLIMTRIISKILYRPMPQDVLPEGSEQSPEGLLNAFKSGLPYLEMDGLGRRG